MLGEFVIIFYLRHSLARLTKNYGLIFLKFEQYPYSYPYIRIKIPVDKSQREYMQLE